MKLKILLLTLATLTFVTACSSSPPDQSAISNKLHGHADTAKGEIAPALLYEKLQRNEKIVLLDVREEAEYIEAHIPGTTHRISVNDISGEKLTAAGINKTDEIVIYCRSGSRSHVAAGRLREMGYTNVWELNSGIIHWMEDGLPVETGRGITPAPTTGTDDSAPNISFDRIKHDFGEVRQFGGTVTTNFKVRNSGAAVLNIGDITTSCACTTANLLNKTIQPGQEAELAVTFNPNLHEEPREKFKRTIFIPSNDPDTPEAELVIEVDILEGL